MIKAIIIDDQINWINELKTKLELLCPAIKVIDSCLSARLGIESIKILQPDVVFLDIEMPGMNGFKLLEQFTKINFAVIFTTCYDHYAVKALHVSALDYLIKPIDRNELIDAVKKIELKDNHSLPTALNLQILLDQMRDAKPGMKKLAVPTLEGFQLIQTDHLMTCNAQDNYTCFLLKDHSKIIACRTLKQIEEQLRDFNHFVRVHHSHIVNLNEVVKYVRGEGGHLIMTDGTSVNVSKTRKINLLKIIYPGRH